MINSLEYPEVKTTKDFLKDIFSSEENLLWGFENHSDDKKLEELFENYTWKCSNIISRGLQLKIFFNKILSQNGENATILFNMKGNSNFICINKKFLGNEYNKIDKRIENLLKDTKFSFNVGSELKLFYIHNKSKPNWKILNEYNILNWNSAGYDPCDDYNQFLLTLLEEYRNYDGYVFEELTNKKLFNGVGEYLRCEILDRININPFKRLKDLTETEIIKLAKEVKNCCLTSYGLLRLHSFKDYEYNPTNLLNWLQCYDKKDKKRIKYKNSYFWFDEEKWKLPDELNENIERE